MRRPKLSSMLVGFNFGVVAVAIAGVGLAGASLLRQMGREQALARVQRSGARALDLIAVQGERLGATAELLAARPDLRRFVRDGLSDSLSILLREFRAARGLDGALVLARGRTLGAAGALVLPGEADLPEGNQRWFLHAAPGSPGVQWTAAAEIPGAGGARVLIGRFLLEEALADLGRWVGLPVTVLTRQTAESRGTEPSIELRLRALGGEEVRSLLAASGQAVGATPLRDARGRIIGLLEVSDEISGSDPGRSRLLGALLALVLAMGGVATLFSLLLARSVARPVEELTAAALRIGHGDFASPLPRGGGREVAALAGAMEAMRDGTQRLLAELRRGQAGAEAILAGITEGVFSVGRARRIRYLNPQAAALLGVTPEQALGRFCGDVLNPEGPGGRRPCEESCPILHARFRGGARKVEHLRLPDGSRRTVLITSSPPGPAAEGGVAVQFQVLRDETEIEAPRRLRDNVLANISHEFRTPLSAQLASLELLRDRLPELSLDELRALVLSIERGTLRLTRLVDNLLESTRIEAGQDALRRRPVALDEVVEEAVGLMAPLFEQRHQALEVDLPYPLPGVIADGPRLVQVFVNLLANAQKFAPEGSEVRIGGAVGEGEIRLWVEDQGPGLPDGAGETIFQRYSRSSGEEPEESGMGLGLFIVKSIIDRHGGRVEARGEATGTRVTVALPRESAGERTAPPTVERGLANEAGGQEPS